MKIHKNVGGEIPPEIAEVYWNSFLRPTENMSYAEAETELSFRLFEIFCEVYPERCPAKIESQEISGVQPKLKLDYGKKKKAAENQPSLF